MHYGNISEFDRKTVVNGDVEYKPTMQFTAVEYQTDGFVCKLEEMLTMNFGGEMRATFERGFKMGHTGQLK